MANIRNLNGTLIAQRIVRLIQQYDLRIAYASGKAALYREEEGKCSALGSPVRSAKGATARAVWETYAGNLQIARERLLDDLREALQFYSERQKGMWMDSFIRGMTLEELSAKYGLAPENVSRAVSSMRRDMELKFDVSLPCDAKPAPEWTARDLAFFLEEKPSRAFVQAIADLMRKGILDVEVLETDDAFQDYLLGIERKRGGNTQAPGASGACGGSRKENDYGK